MAGDRGESLSLRSTICAKGMVASSPRAREARIPGGRAGHRLTPPQADPTAPEKGSVFLQTPLEASVSASVKWVYVSTWRADRLKCRCAKCLARPGASLNVRVISFCHTPPKQHQTPLPMVRKSMCCAQDSRSPLLPKSGEQSVPQAKAGRPSRPRTPVCPTEDRTRAGGRSTGGAGPARILGSQLLWYGD